MMAATMAVGLLLPGGCARLHPRGEPGGSMALTPITAEPTGVTHVGKFVWHDLLTPDPAAARAFYGGLLGWDFRDNGAYIEILHHGRKIGGIVERKPKEGSEPVASWLASMSVADVDEAVSWANAHGGEIISGPVDMPLRGRGALIKDPQGAYLVALHAKGGDPPDAHARIGEWLWDEVWSTLPEAATSFYRGLGRYASTLEGEGYVILINEGRWRAGVRRVGRAEYHGRWVPVIRVEDPAALLDEVEGLGGIVLVRPGEGPTDVDTALITDNRGALLMLQRWTYPAETEEHP